MEPGVRGPGVVTQSRKGCNLEVLLDPTWSHQLDSVVFRCQREELLACTFFMKQCSHGRSLFNLKIFPAQGRRCYTSVLGRLSLDRVQISRCRYDLGGMWNHYKGHFRTFRKKVYLLFRN